MISLAFVIVAIILFVLSAFNVSSPVSLLSLGLAFWAASTIIGRL